MMTHQEATSDDILAIIALFQQSVRQATVRDYNEVQREAWATQGADEAKWQQRMATQYFLLGERSSQLLGFGSISAEGYLDTLFVHPNHQREGVASGLLRALEAWAMHRKIGSIYSNASLTARPFFERKGYHLLREQQNVVEGTGLVNFRMEKTL